MTLAKTAARIAYDAGLCASWPFLYLYYLCRSGTDGKYSGNYRARMGLDLPGPLREGAERAWFHALSVGETLSALPLVKEVKKRRPDLEILFSTATETGMSLARERLSGEVDRFFFLPHDFPWAVRRLVRRIRPGFFVLIETDFWPNLIRALKREGALTALVNGRISPRSYRRYLRLAGLAEMVFGGFDLVFTQTGQDRLRFESLGAPSGKVTAAGNLKFESSVPVISESEAASVRDGIGLEPGRPVWVAGSTHAGEEEFLLRVHAGLLAKNPDLLLIIAPRNIGRRGEIESLCAGFGLGCAVRSRAEAASGKPVYLLDTLGELAKIYSLCDVAFIGGSLVPLGGHNPLEAAAQGKPACWGPHFFNFSEIEAALLASGRCTRVASEKELSDFVQSNLEGAKSGATLPGPWASGMVAGFAPGTASRIASALLEKI